MPAHDSLHSCMRGFDWTSELVINIVNQFAMDCSGAHEGEEKGDFRGIWGSVEVSLVEVPGVIPSGCLGVLVPSVVAKKWNYEISHPFLTFYFIISCTTLRRKDERPFFDGFDRRRTGNQNLGELRQAIVGFKTGSKRFKLGSKKRPARTRSNKTRSNLFPYPRLNMFR